MTIETFLPMVLGGLLAAVGFFLKGFKSNSESDTISFRLDIRDVMVEVGKLQGENERQWKNIEEVKAEIRELRK